MVTLTISQFRVDLDQLESAIGTVQAQADTINTNCQEITTVMQAVPASWNTPASQPFGQLTSACIAQMNTLTDLLAEMISRMQAAHQTYLDMEQTNFNNLSSGSDPGGGGPSGGQRTRHPRADRQSLLLRSHEAAPTEAVLRIAGTTP